MEINEIRTGKLEFSDENRNRSRNRYIMMMQIMIYLIPLIILSILLVYWITSSKEIFGLSLIIPLLIIAIIKIKSKLIEDIHGFVLLIGEGSEVETLQVLTWKQGKNDEFIEDDVRFNQAVGFLAIMNEDGLIELYIIVHRNFPGELIFVTEDMDTLVELKRCLNIIFPDKEEWYNEMEDGGEWDEEDTEEFDELSTSTRVPIILREYFPI